jgi:WhiB family redox-sensing transcriptional regulator
MLLDVVNDAKWMDDRAACRSAENPDLWFAESVVPQRIAASICRRECPLIEQCLAYALERGPTAKGVWGGTTERDRWRMRRGVSPVARIGRPPKV